jgi:hypothetical protein
VRPSVGWAAVARGPCLREKGKGARGRVRPVGGLGRAGRFQAEGQKGFKELGFELNLSGPLKFKFHSTGSHKLKAKQFEFNTKFKTREIAIKSKDFKYSY